ncbi:MAG TPA: hypothetical protein VL866_10490 [Pyrinomonadaceae bacterium]|nr:hypothetical protein [Pyrinomonadaceae bacterium]
MNGNRLNRRSLYVVATLWCLCSFSSAYTQDLPYRFHPGMRISKMRPPTIRQLSGLMRELVFFSGLDLKVDHNGSIHYEHELPELAGSAIARELLATAIGGPDSFTVESANHSPQIAFAQIESILDYTDRENQRATEWVIRIDFADFAQLRGDTAVLKTFSPGTNLLHELIHAILKLPDPAGPSDRLGPCERYLNLIRAELGLPLRQNYFPKNRIARTPESLSQILQGELTFTHEDPKLKNAKHSSLTFDLARIVDPKKVRSDRSLPPDLVALSSRLPIQKR